MDCQGDDVVHQTSSDATQTGSPFKNKLRNMLHRTVGRESTEREKSVMSSSKEGGPDDDMGAHMDHSVESNPDLAPHYALLRYLKKKGDMREARKLESLLKDPTLNPNPQSDAELRIHRRKWQPHRRLSLHYRLKTT